MSAVGQAANPLGYVASSRNLGLIYAYIVIYWTLIKEKEKKVRYVGSNPDLPLTSQPPYHYTRMNNW